MLTARIQRFTDTLREGAGAGFVTGLVVLFLILIGVPIRIQNLALFSLLFVPFIFGAQLGRKLHPQGMVHTAKNVLVLGVVAALMVYLFMALINRWQANGIDVKTYFDAVNTETVSLLSGVPEEELHPNPKKDLFSGEYPEGAELRTDPMRLTFDRDTALHLKFGLGETSWIDLNLIIGGFYGFLLLLIASGMLGAAVAWLVIVREVGSARQRMGTRLAENPLSHWAVLLSPALLFGALWLTVAPGGGSPILDLGASTQEIQLLMGFALVLFALVAMRAAEPRDWGLTYSARLGAVAAAVGVLVFVGALRVHSGPVLFITTPNAPAGHELFSILAIVLVGAAVLAQNAYALRAPGRFERQLTGTLAVLILLLMPLFLDQYQNDVMTLVGINIMLGLGLNIVVGYAGLLDLGYVAFFALGAYTYAFLSSNQQIFDDQNNPIRLKFEGNDAMVVKMTGWVTITVVVTALVVGAGLWWWRKRQQEAGKPLIRTERTLIPMPAHPGPTATFALTALAVAVSVAVSMVLERTGIYHTIFHDAPPFLIGLVAGLLSAGLAGIALGIPVLRLRGDYLAIVTLGFGEIIRLLFNNLRDLTGGPQGVLQIPRPLPVGASGPGTYLIVVYLVFIGAGLVAFFSTRLKQSRTGRAWSAMKSDEDIAQSMGINLVQSKLMAFAIGASFAGLGGVLFAARQRNIFPQDFNLEVSIEVLSLVIIGGMGSIPGVIMGAIALIGIPEVLRELATYRILAFGALLITMVIIRPEGILPAPPTQLQEKARALAQRARAEKDGSA